MRVKKSTAYITGMVTLTLMYFVTLLTSIDAAVAIGPGVVLGIVGVTTAYIGGNVADNGVKGRFYNEALKGE